MDFLNYYEKNMSSSPWEDNLLERKVESDLKDLLKTLVAFSNSVKPDHIAVLLIGERDDGSIQGVKNPDNIQKKVRQECDKIYPAIFWRSKVYEADGKMCIRVEISYSGETPHFGGQAWIRKGSETIKATDDLFQSLIDLRSSVVSELEKWKGKKVTVQGDLATLPNYENKRPLMRSLMHRWPMEETVSINFVNKHWVTFELSQGNDKRSEPLSKLSLSYDHNNDRLKVIVIH